MPARVLIIDDDLMVTRLLQEHLYNEGYDVESFHMAEQGLAGAVKNPPDLIMLDVNLPDATGFQVCGKLREHPKTQGLPIIMMSGDARSTSQQAIGKQLGANEYVLKPLDIVSVGDRVHSYIGTKRVRRKSPLNESAIEQPSESTMPVTPELTVNSDTIQAAFSAPPFSSTAPNGNYPPSGLVLMPMHDLMENGPAVYTPPPRGTEENEPPAGASRWTIPADSPPTVTPSRNLPFPIADPVIEMPPLPEEPPPQEALATFEPEAPTETPAPLTVNPSPIVEEPQPLSVESPLPIVEIPPAAAEPEMPAVPTESIPEKEPVRPKSRPVPLRAIPLRPNKPSLLTPMVIFISHLAITWISTLVGPEHHGGALSIMTFVAGGWALLLGLVVGTSALLNITLEASDAWRVVGWAAIPIVLQSMVHLGGLWIPALAAARIETAQLSAATFWLRPLDVFEISALVILGLRLRLQPGSSLQKSLIGALVAGIAWSLAGRGYFRPF